LGERGASVWAGGLTEGDPFSQVYRLAWSSLGHEPGLELVAELCNDIVHVWLERIGKIGGVVLCDGSLFSGVLFFIDLAEEVVDDLAVDESATAEVHFCLGEG